MSQQNEEIAMPLLQSDNKTSKIYKINTEELRDLFRKELGREDRMEKLAAIGPTSADIVTKLASHPNCGIIGDDRDLMRRTKMFGQNTMPKATPASIIDSIKDIFNERLTIVAMITALLSAITGGIEKKAWVGTVEGFGLLIFIIVVNLIITSFDYLKDNRFLKLQEFLKKERVSVIRGKAFQTRSISVWKLVVGDIIILEAGSRVPADCLVIESTNLKVQGTEDNADRNKETDPFLYAGQIIAKGNGRVVVCAVGGNSSRSLKDEKVDLNQDSALNQKLDNIAKQLMLFAIITAGVIFVQLLIFLFINISQAEDKWLTFLGGLPKRFNQAVVLAIVSFPEGLALTFQLSMAFVVMQMYKRDNVLVRDIEAPEIMGQAEEIIVGKTGTITKGDMHVKKLWVRSQQDKWIVNTRKNTLTNCNIPKEELELIKEAILFNSQARIETDETYYVPHGNPTDTCMINFLQDADIPVHLVVQRKINKDLGERGFKEGSRTYVTAVQNYNDPEKVDIFIKGAPEEVLDEALFDADNNELEIDTAALIEMVQKEAQETGYRMIAFGHMTMEKAVFDEEIASFENDFEQFIAEKKFSPIAVFALKDGLRPEVKSAVEYARSQANLQVRLVSNDLMETAVYAAKSSNIIRGDEETAEDSIMKGEDFYARIGGIELNRPIAGDLTYNTLVNMEEFAKISKNLRVLYRAEDSHKEALVIGLKSLRFYQNDYKLENEIKLLEDEKKQRNMMENMASKIVVTGEGPNDVEALKEAQIGVAMNAGCAAAKDAAALVLTDDNFKSCLQSVLWGRNIYQNVTRFLQFQMTVNLACVISMFISVFFYSELPMSSAQLLWVNLIMDVIAAVALGTEPPMPSLVKGDPREQTGLLKQKQVWRQIIGVSAYMVLIILLLNIFGPSIVAKDKDIPWNGYAKLDIPQPKNCQKYPETLVIGQAAAKACKEYRQSAAKGTLLTYIFNTFVFMQIFNLINCRKLGAEDKNVLEKPFHNFYFLICFFGMIGTQIMLVQYADWLIHTVPLTSRSEWGASMTIGLSVLLVAFLLKLTPKAWVDRIPEVVNEDNKPKNAIVDKTSKALGLSTTDGDTPEDEGDAEPTEAEGEEEEGNETDGGEPVDAEAGIGNGFNTGADTYTRV